MWRSRSLSLAFVSSCSNLVDPFLVKVCLLHSLTETVPLHNTIWTVGCTGRHDLLDDSVLLDKVALCKMGSTPQGSKSGTSQYYGASAKGSFTDHSREDTSSGDEVSTTSVGQPHYRRFDQNIPEASPAVAKWATVSSHTDYEPSMASPPSAGDESNEYSVHTAAWQQLTKETSYSFGSESGGFVCGTCAQRFQRRADLERHERIIHVNKASRPYKCEVLGCRAGVTSWTKLEGLQAHNEAWHGDELALVSNNKDDEFHYAGTPDYSSSTQYTTTTGAAPGFVATQGPSELTSGLAQMSLGTGSSFISFNEPRLTGRAVGPRVLSKNPTTSREEFDHR